MIPRLRYSLRVTASESESPRRPLRGDWLVMAPAPARELERDLNHHSESESEAVICQCQCGHGLSLNLTQGASQGELEVHRGNTL
jgi:hypothetical protein